MKQLQSETSLVFLLADKEKPTVILNHESYLEKCVDLKNNVLNHLLQENPTTKIKAKMMKHLKALKECEFINNKLYYYVQPTDSPVPKFYCQPKIHKPEVLIHTIVSHSGLPLCNVNNVKF